jgi:hypothetical protein
MIVVRLDNPHIGAGPATSRLICGTGKGITYPEDCAR